MLKRNKTQIVMVLFIDDEEIQNENYTSNAHNALRGPSRRSSCQVSPL